MASVTTRKIPRAACVGDRSSALARASPSRRSAAAAVELHVAAEEIVGIEQPEHQVGVGDGRLVAAAAVAGRTGIGAGALRADLEQPERVDMGDAAAAGADLDHVDRRDGDRQPAAFLEAVAAVDLEQPGDQRLAVLDQAGLGGGAAHVEGHQPVEAERLAHSGRRRARPRPVRSRSCAPGCVPAVSAPTTPPELSMISGALGKPSPREPLAQPSQIGLRDRHRVGVDAGGRGARDIRGSAARPPTTA